MSPMTKVLIVEDDVAFALMLRTWLSKNGYEAESVVSAEQAVKRMGECVFDVVLSDLRLPDRDGITLLEWIRHKSPHSEVIIMTGYANVSTAVAAIKLGAFDYLEKPVNPEILREKMTAAVTRHEQRRSRPETQSASEPGTAIVWGHSEASAKLRDHLLLVAPTNMSVLITGESGTGKELFAQALHAASPRKDHPFIAVNCAAIPENLLEGILFGTSKGAYTDAADKPGLFEKADGGTLLLDELNSMPLGLQAKLLRVLQEKRIRRLGASSEKDVEVRGISILNEPPLTAVSRGILRNDLYYRLAVVGIAVPPLRERLEDIPLLIASFLQRAEGAPSGVRVADSVMKLFWGYSWPGNIRELLHVIEGSLALIGSRNVITEDCLPRQFRDACLSRRAAEAAPQPVQAEEIPLIDDYRSVRRNSVVPLKEKINAFEARCIRNVLRVTGGNVSKAARIMDLTGPGLRYKMKQLGIGEEDY